MLYIHQLVAAQSRCRDILTAKDGLEEEVSGLRRERQASEKRLGQVRSLNLRCVSHMCVMSAATR